MNANWTRNRTTTRRPRGTTRNDSRRGYALLEIAVSILLLMVAMNVTVKVLGWVGAERRAADRRQWAVQEVSNVMEKVGSEPFDRVTADRARALAVGTRTERVLPGAEWSVAVEDDREAAVPAKRLTLQLRWKDRTADWGAPVRLTSWVFRRGNPK